MKKLRLFLLSFLLLSSMGLIFAGTPKEVRIVDVTDASFTVVWYTDQAEQGYIEWGNLTPNTTAFDLRGSSVSDNIHIVVVNSLTSTTDYFFQIKSGGNSYLNNGQNFVVRTAKDSIVDAGVKLNLDKVYRLDSISILTTKDVLVFARAINSLDQNSISKVILYKNNYISSIDYPLGYRRSFDINSFRDKDGKPLPSPIVSVELVAWTANEGFGFNNVLTINYAPATFDVYLDTANLVFYAGVPTTNPVVPTVDPVVPTPDPTSNVTSINGFLLENFETDSNAFTNNEFLGYNYPYRNDDSLWGYSILSEGANGTTKSYRQNYILQGTRDVYSGYGLDLKPSKAEMDISTFGAIRFIAKGTGQMAIELEATNNVISDYNHYFKAISLNTDWQEYVISFSRFSQENWGTQVDLVTALQRMVAVKFKAYPQVAGTSGWFQIDEIYLATGDMGSVTTSPTIYPKDRIITDFQNGTGQNSWGGYDYSYDDNGIPNFGNSVITMNIISDGVSKVAFVSYDVNAAFAQPFVGIGFGLDVVTTNPQDISRFSGIKFRAKGDAVINVEVNSTVYSDYNRHYKQVAVANTSTWNTYYVYFTDMSQENWGSKVALIDVLKNALAVQLKIGKTNDKGQIYIDDVEFIDNIAPQKVQHLSANLVGSTARLSWNSSIGANGYYVVRNITNYPYAGTFPISKTEGTKFLVTGNTFMETLSTNSIYYYSIFAYYDKSDEYSDATTADKTLMILEDGGLLSLITEITVNETVRYVHGSSTLNLRNGDYVSSNLTLIVTVDAQVSTTHSFTLIVKSNGATLNNSVTITPSVTSNTVTISITLTDTGINDLQIFAVANWLVDRQSNVVYKSVMVADASSVVTLKPGSKILCHPMPYDPNSIDPMDIAYELTAESDVSIYVYNLLGQVVWKNLYCKGFEGANAGYNQVSFNGVDAFGDKLAIGMYFIQIVHGKSVLGTSKFLVTR
jgi:hypothetical protein